MAIRCKVLRLTITPKLTKGIGSLFTIVTLFKTEAIVEKTTGTKNKKIQKIKI